MRNDVFAYALTVRHYLHDYKKETQSVEWTLLSFAIPTVTGMLICFIIANTARLFMAL